MNAHPRDFTPEERATHFGERRELPDAIEAEQALLGAILMNNEAISAVPPTFQAEFLESDVHQKIYRVMLDLHGRGKKFNLVTLKSFLNDVDIVKGLTVSQYLAKLASNAVSIIGVEDFAWATTEASVRRGMVSVSNVIMGAAFERELSLIDEIEAARSYLDELHTRLTGADGAGTSVSEALDKAISRTRNAMAGNDEVGVDCGLEPVTQLIGRMTPGQLIIIGGGTKQGKSALAGQLTIGAARNGWPCFTYSGEMGADELTMREMSRIARISVARQKEGDLSGSEYELLTAARNELRKLPWHIQDRRRNLDQLSAEFVAFVKRNGRSVLVVDSVTQIERDRSTQRMSSWEFAEVVTDRLKGLGRKTDSPVIALSQLKKNTFEVEKVYGKKVEAKTYRNVVNRRPRATDLLGACERDADHVLIPFNPMPILEDIEPAEGSDEHVLWEGVRDEFEGKAQIILALSRERRPGRRDVRWDGETTSFLPKQSYAQREMF